MGIYIPYPQPLRTCPGLSTWIRHSGTAYLLFVDESFSGFFEHQERGYFCHGAVGIPESEYDSFKVGLRPVFERYRQTAGLAATEFKHRDFRRMPFLERQQFARNLRDLLTKHGAFIQGFYTPMESFILERVRAKVMDIAPSVPADYRALRSQVIADLCAQRDQAAGQSAVLVALLLQPLGAFAHMMAALDCRFRLFCDPREPREDRAVHDRLRWYADAMKNVWKETESRCLAIENTRTSEEEPGLQIADLVTGETRDFFAANRDLMEYGSNPRIITQSTDEPIMTTREFAGSTWKDGVLTRMPNALQRRFVQPDPKERSVLSEFASLLAAGSLACYARWGTPRWLMVYEHGIIDQTDR